MTTHTKWIRLLHNDIHINWMHYAYRDNALSSGLVYMYSVRIKSIRYNRTWSECAKVELILWSFDSNGKPHCSGSSGERYRRYAIVSTTLGQTESFNQYRQIQGCSCRPSRHLDWISFYGDLDGDEGMRGFHNGVCVRVTCTVHVVYYVHYVTYVLAYLSERCSAHRCISKPARSRRPRCDGWLVCTFVTYYIHYAYCRLYSNVLWICSNRIIGIFTYIHIAQHQWLIYHITLPTSLIIIYTSQNTR